MQYKDNKDFSSKRNNENSEEREEYYSNSIGGTKSSYNRDNNRDNSRGYNRDNNRGYNRDNNRDNREGDHEDNRRNNGENHRYSNRDNYRGGEQDNRHNNRDNHRRDDRRDNRRDDRRDNRRDDRRDNKRDDRRDNRSSSPVTFENASVLISFVVIPESSFSEISTALFSLATSTLRKQKIIVSYIDKSNKELRQGLENNFKNYSNLIFSENTSSLATPTANITALHNKALKASNATVFLITDSTVSLKIKSLEKMVRFLLKDSSNCALVPRYYADNKLFPSCRRFFKLTNLLSSPSEKNKKHRMFERGSQGYLLTHRVDWSFLNCLLVLSKNFTKVEGIPTTTSQSIRDAIFCKKIQNSKQKIIYFPHAYALLSKKIEEEYGTFEFIKYLLKCIF